MHKEKQIRRRCEKDILFWVNTFGWTFDPRKDPSVLPMICYPYQEEVLLEMDRIFGREDYGCLAMSCLFEMV